MSVTATKSPDVGTIATRDEPVTDTNSDARAPIATRDESSESDWGHWDWHEARQRAVACDLCDRPLTADEPVWQVLQGAHRLFSYSYQRKFVCETCAPATPGARLRFARLSCALCGRTVWRSHRLRLAKSVFCSRRCEWTHYNRRQQARLAAARRKVCLGCGQSFQAGRRDATTCSATCRQRAYRQRHPSGGLA